MAFKDIDEFADAFWGHLFGDNADDVSEEDEEYFEHAMDFFRQLKEEDNKSSGGSGNSGNSGNSGRRRRRSSTSSTSRRTANPPRRRSDTSGYGARSIFG